MKSRLRGWGSEKGGGETSGTCRASGDRWGTKTVLPSAQMTRVYIASGLEDRTV